jgi:hypothetical protein
VGEASLDELADSYEDVVAVREVGGIRRDVADDLLERQESGMVLKQDPEHGLFERTHSPVGHKCSKYRGASLAKTVSSCRRASPTADSEATAATMSSRASSSTAQSVST